MKRPLALLFCALTLSSSNCLADLSFSATSLTGESVQVAQGSASKFYVICFLGAECPMAKVYAERLQAMSERFHEHDVLFVGVNSNRQDSAADVREYVDLHGISFPFVKDRNNLIADRYNARRTPEVFVLNSRLEILYQGRIDDQYQPGVSRVEPTRRDLQIAIQQAVAGQVVTTSVTDATGCFIGRVRPSGAEPIENNITFRQHVVPVLNQHCVECHRPNEIGPFAMNNYDEVVGWAETMLETIDSGRMPPWHADPQIGHFANARLMSDPEKQILRDWVAGGSKEGASFKLPPVPEFSSGWQLEKDPEQIVQMRSRPFTVPRDGVVEYQYFVADPKFEEDKWISGAQVLPGARSVVHHAIVFIRPPDGSDFRGTGWLSAYVPGQRMIPLPDGRARRVPAGSKLVFQMHYTPNGRQTDDISRIGLVFAEEEDVSHEVFTIIGINQEFEIPPHSSEHTVSGGVDWIPQDGELIAVTPHMHFRGKAVSVFTDAAGAKPLLRVPQYDFNWQHTYALAEPMPLGDLTSLSFTSTFDNSADNPFNPDPETWVTWGDQTWEEMAVVFFEISQPRESARAGRRLKQETMSSEQRQMKIDSYVKRAFAKMDANNDGVIKRGESPIVVRFFHFGRIDRDGDGSVTRDELVQTANRLYGGTN